MDQFERWQKVKDILYAALEMDSAERSSFLDEKCRNEPALRAEIESLLAADDSGKRLESPAVEVLAPVVFDARGAVLVGTLLGHYEVIEKIGAGGMGEVYLAQDTTLGRKVALKLLPSFFTQDPERLRRFQQEARIASALNHPNILTIHEIGHVNSSHYIATEFIEGETLRERMTHGPLKITEALDIAIQVAGALSTAHEAGIIHRDIKPENIMLRQDGIVKVLDFGLVKLIERPAVDTEASTMVNTGEGIVMGTAQYMSPEQARGLSVDPRTDIWSLGCVIYEMLAGRAPFSGPTASDVIVSILEKEAPPIARYGVDLPSELEWLIKKALRKERDERYQTSKELLSDLRNIRQRLEFESQLEQSSSPERDTAPAINRAISSRIVDETAERTIAHPTSSAEYIVTEIKHHKIAAILIVLALVSGLSGYVYYFRTKVGPIESMAILPFVNAGTDADPEAEYLSDGITESLINSLSQLPDMRMIARTSAERYKDREVDPKTVASELGVQALLTGKVVRRGDSMVISAELIDTRDNRHIWGEQYNRKVSDVLAVQQEIAREIAEKLRGRLTGDEQRRVTRNYTQNVEAYELYLRGRYHWNKRTAVGLRQAIDYFRQAIERDPNYALAYSGLADSYSNLQGYAGVPASEVVPRARAAALRSLEIDDSLAEAHASLGLIYYSLWQWEESERELRRAIELNSNYASAHHWYCLWLEAMGRTDEALEEIRRAQALDPLSPSFNSNLARHYFKRNQFDRAVNECRKVIELNPNFPDAHRVLALVYQKQERHDEAIAEFQKTVEVTGGVSNALGALGYGYATGGRRPQALAIVRELEDKHARREAHGAMIAMIYAGLGEKDQAFAWLEKGFQDGGSTMVNIITLFPFLDTLRSDPRYADLLRRMGLPSNLTS
jgi:serine/threonine-protein kinase